MSFHCSQGLAGDFSLVAYLAGIRSAPSRLKVIRGMCCSKDSGTGYSITSPSGTTYVLSTENPGEGLSMLFRGDFPAKTSVLRVGVKDLPGAVVDCGMNTSESLTRYGLVMSLRKTHRICVEMASAPSSKDLPAWGMVYDGACWELGMSVRHTEETGCGYWPTPTAMQRPNEGNMRLVRARAVAGEIGWEEAEALVGKDVRLAHGKLKAYWATPASRDWKDTPGMATSSVNKDGSIRNRLDQLARQVYHAEGEGSGGGKLNPMWVEVIMGFPKGWSGLEPVDSMEMCLWESGFSDAKESERTTKTMRAMQETDMSHKVSRAVGGLVSLSEASILFSELCKHAGQVDQARVFMACEEAFEAQVRGLRGCKKTPSTPHRSRNIEQLVEQYPDALRAVSRLLAFYGKAAWASGCWENAIPRVALKVPSRMERLKALGNGQVPECAAAAFRILSA